MSKRDIPQQMKGEIEKFGLINTCLIKALPQILCCFMIKRTKKVPCNTKKYKGNKFHCKTELELCVVIFFLRNLTWNHIVNSAENLREVPNQNRTLEGLSSSSSIWEKVAVLVKADIFSETLKVQWCVLLMASKMRANDVSANHMATRDCTLSSSRNHGGTMHLKTEPDALMCYRNDDGDAWHHWG